MVFKVVSPGATQLAVGVSVLDFMVESAEGSNNGSDPKRFVGNLANNLNDDFFIHNALYLKLNIII